MNGFPRFARAFARATAVLGAIASASSLADDSPVDASTVQQISLSLERRAAVDEKREAPPARTDDPVPPVSAAEASGDDAIRQVQDRLNMLGYEAGRADGKLGPATRAALSLFQENNGLEATGRLDPTTSSLLQLSESAAAR